MVGKIFWANIQACELKVKVLKELPNGWLAVRIVGTKIEMNVHRGRLKLYEG